MMDVGIFLVVSTAAAVGSVHASCPSIGLKGQVIFVVDGTDNLNETEFGQMQYFMTSIVEELVFDKRRGWQVGVCVFGNTTESTIPIGLEKPTVLGRIQNLTFPSAIGHNIKNSMWKVYRYLTDPARNRGADDTQIVVIVLADDPNDLIDAMKWVSKCHTAGIVVIVVSVGPVQDSTLNALSVKAINVMKMTDFNQLVADHNQVLELIVSNVDLCPDGACGFNVNARSCSKFSHCSATLVPLENTCSPGTFWNNDQLACIRINKVDCLLDPCRCAGPLATNASFPEGGCTALALCQNGRIAGVECCLAGESVDPDTLLCVSDTNCTDVCTPVIQTTPTVCEFEMLPGYPRNYRGIADNSVRGKCNALLKEIFDEQSCSCVPVTTVISNSNCREDLFIDFDQGAILDRSHSGCALEETNVVVEHDADSGNGYVGRFDGFTSKIRVKFFNNVPWGGGVRVEVRYKADATCTGVGGPVEAILSNADCDVQVPSLEIVHNRDLNGRIEGFLFTGISRYIYCTPNTEWNTVVLEYNGLNGKISQAVNSDIRREKDLIGHVKKSKCDLAVGSGHKRNNFKGVIDYIKIYRCNP